MPKVNCIYHKDDTASMEIYSDGYYCFGCGAKGTLASLSTNIPDFVVKHSFKNSFKEDVVKSLSRINSLPTKNIRGLELPFDSSGYYIVYPQNNYYIKRVWNSASLNKYRGPKGVPKPMYALRLPFPQETLLLIEGQINALSVDQSYRGEYVSIVSPGSATDLNKPNNLNYYLRYNYICIIVDADAAGIAAGIQLRDTLLKANKRVSLYPMKEDLNELLCNYGAERVCEEIKKALEM